MRQKLLLWTSLILTGCATSRHPDQVVTTTTLSPNDVERVRTPEIIQTYYQNRTPTQDRTGMHEAHRFYRFGQTANWDLMPLQSPLSSIGPVKGLRDVTLQAPSQDKQILAELNRQKEISGRLVKAEEDLKQATLQIREKSQGFQGTTGVIMQLKDALKKEREEKERLQKLLDQINPTSQPQTSSNEDVDKDSLLKAWSKSTSKN